MICRLAEPNDRDQVLRLFNQLGEIVNERVHFDPDNVRSHILGKENYDDAITRDDRRIFVAENEGEIVAVATFFILTDFITAKPFAHIDDFVVEKKLRGQGIGTALMSYIKTYARGIRITTIELTSSLPLTEAHRFYEKQGAKYCRKVMKFEL